MGSTSIANTWPGLITEPQEDHSHTSASSSFGLTSDGVTFSLCAQNCVIGLGSNGLTSFEGSACMYTENYTKGDAAAVPLR